MERLDSISNEKIKLSCKIATSSKARKEHNLFFLEGLRLCRDAAVTGVKIKFAFFTNKAEEKFPADTALIRSKSQQSFSVSDAVANKLSQTENTQGFFCLCEKQKEKLIDEIDCKGKYIALENIQDPSNLGAICRTAEALGISGAVLCGCCDRYNPKSQRAAMGSLLRLPVFETVNLKETLLSLEEKGMKLYATSPDSSALKITSVSMLGGVISVIGNEANGVTREVFDVCEKVTIPMLGKAESLNASMAASIVMWEMMR